MQRNYLLFFPKVEGVVCNRMEGLNFNEKIINWRSLLMEMSGG